MNCISNSEYNREYIKENFTDTNTEQADQLVQSILNNRQVAEQAAKIEEQVAKKAAINKYIIIGSIILLFILVILIFIYSIF